MKKVLLALVATLVFGIKADEVSIARQALRDSLWTIARNHASKIDGDEAKLIVLESYAGEGRWDEIAKVLAQWKDVKGRAFDYYRAIVKGDYGSAMSLLKEVGSYEGILEARLYEAEMLAKLNKRTEATKIWTEIAATTNLNDRALSIVSSNLMDISLLRKAYATIKQKTLRDIVGVRLGVALLKDASTANEGVATIRKIVKASPDIKGGKDAYIAVAKFMLDNKQWKSALDYYNETMEIWPDTAKIYTVQYGKGWALLSLSKVGEALETFGVAVEMTTNDLQKANALAKCGDALSLLGRTDEARAKYQEVISKFPSLDIAERLKIVVRMNDMEAEGRKLFKDFRFAEAMKLFEQIAAEESDRRQRMRLFIAMCLYGQGLDEEAASRVQLLVADCADAKVRADAMLWLAKFQYNRREWADSKRLFLAHAELIGEKDDPSFSILWAARAALLDNDAEQAIRLTTKIFEQYSTSSHKIEALILQGEVLIELARFNEAILVFDRVMIADKVQMKDKLRVSVLKADALYTLGADNASHYESALNMYRSVLDYSELTESAKIIVAFKIARTLEKLRRVDEALDQYYANVVLAYRDLRARKVILDDEAKAAFSRAALCLADEYESRGKNQQALNVLELLASSDVPAADEAAKRIIRFLDKGDGL